MHLLPQFEKVRLKNHADHIIDVSQVDDMTERFCASDVLIANYSSLAFDAICAYISVFLYADDLKEYVKDGGRLMKMDIGSILINFRKCMDLRKMVVWVSRYQR